MNKLVSECIFCSLEYFIFVAIVLVHAPLHFANLNKFDLCHNIRHKVVADAVSVMLPLLTCVSID